MKGYRQVPKEEFYIFIRNYSKKLEWDCYGVYEPPLGSYNDFSDGKKWPESIVGVVQMYDLECHGKDKEYYIKSTYYCMQHIVTAYQKFKVRKYEFIYWSIDLHSTIITGTYDLNNEGSEFYPWGIEVLQNLTKNPKMKLILWTSSHYQPIQDFLRRVDPYSIYFDYINENPECIETKLCDFNEKFFFDILIDDKAGFDPSKDWGFIRDTLKEIGEWV